MLSIDAIGAAILRRVPADIDALVVSNDRLSEAYNVVGLAAPELAAAVEPGQFVMVRAAGAGGPLLRRPFSVYEILRDAHGQVLGFSLLNKRVGVVTGALYALEPGARLQCLGPLGRPFSVGAPPAAAWMVAGGVGLAPFATLAAALRARGTPTTLFYGGRGAADLFHVDRFERLGVRVVLATEDGSRGAAGFITAPLERELGALPAAAPLTIHACGPTGMMRVVAELAAAHARRVEVSLEPVMGCGLGGCYSCVVPLRDRPEAATSRLVRSCLRGPVFPGHQVVWDELVH